MEYCCFECNDSVYEEILQNLQDAYTKYQCLSEKHQNSKQENRNLECEIHSLKNELNDYKADLYQFQYQENNHKEEIEFLICELDIKEKELIHVYRELAEKNEILKSNACKKHIMECKLEPISISCPDSSKKESLTECMGGSDCEQNNYDITENLLRALENYSKSNDTCDPYRPLIEKSRITICNLIEDNNAQTASLKKYEDMASRLKVKISTMTNEISLIVNALIELNNDKETLESKCDSMSHKLYAKIEEENKLSIELKSSKEEIVNMRYALNVRIEEKSQMVRELSAKNQIIEEKVQIKEELEKKLITVVNKLQETEMSKNVCSTKLADLEAQNEIITSKLEEIQKDNNEKNTCIDNLKKQILDMDTIIQASNINRKNYEEEIVRLKEECSTVECKSDDAVEKLNKIIETLHNELKTTKMELTVTLEGSLKKDEERESLIVMKRSLEQDKENLMYQLKDLESQNNSLMKTKLNGEIELNRLKNEINSFKEELTKVTAENDEKQNKIMQNVKNLEVQQCTIEKLQVTNRELEGKLQILERKNYDLKLANDQIENYDLEINAVNKKWIETCEVLKCTEQKLKDAELKINEETCRNAQINEEYCKLKNKCNCGGQMNQTVACGASEKEAKVCLKCTGCQTDITGKRMLNENLEYHNMLKENERLVCENATLCSETKDLKEDVQDLRYLNRVLEESMEVQKDRTSCSKLSVHVGLQTSLCSLGSLKADKYECPNDCNPCHSEPSAGVCLKTATSACSCTSNACSCSGSKDALAKCNNNVDSERKTLKEQLNDVLDLCNEKEMIIRCKESELNMCKLRECQLQQEVEKLGVQIQAYSSDMCSVQSKQVTDLEKWLETTSSQSPKELKKRLSSTEMPQRNLEKRVSSTKRPKAGVGEKMPSKILGFKLPYIPCCVGSTDPCNRLKMWEASQARMASSSLNCKGADKVSAVPQQSKKSLKVDSSSSSVAVGLSRYEQLMYGDRSLADRMLPESEKQPCSLAPEEIDVLRRQLEGKTNSQYRPQL